MRVIRISRRRTLHTLWIFIRFMLSKWKKDFREGRLKPAANAAGLSLPRVLRTDPEKTQLKRQVKELEEKVAARAEARGLERKRDDSRLHLLTITS